MPHNRCRLSVLRLSTLGADKRSQPLDGVKLRRKRWRNTAYRRIGT